MLRLTILAVSLVAICAMSIDKGLDFAEDLPHNLEFEFGKRIAGETEHSTTFWIQSRNIHFKFQILRWPIGWNIPAQPHVQFTNGFAMAANLSTTWNKRSKRDVCQSPPQSSKYPAWNVTYPWSITPSPSVGQWIWFISTYWRRWNRTSKHYGFHSFKINLDPSWNYRNLWPTHPMAMKWLTLSTDIHFHFVLEIYPIRSVKTAEQNMTINWENIEKIHCCSNFRSSLASSAKFNGFVSSRYYVL